MKKIVTAYLLIVFGIMFIPNSISIKKECIKIIKPNCNINKIDNYISDADIILKICNKDYCYLPNSINKKIVINNFVNNYYQTLNEDDLNLVYTKGFKVTKIYLDTCSP